MIDSKADSSTYSPPAYPPPYPPPSGPPQTQTNGIQFARDADYLIQSFLPAYELPHQPSGIPLPLCTPQIADTFDAPFARGYNPVLLDSVGISQDQLLAFIDGLNLAMTASPPLRVVNFAGKPYHWAMIAGAVSQTAAQVGIHVISKRLTDRYLRAANLRLFKPKGLVVRLCTTAAMQHLVMRTGDGTGPSKLNKFGRGVGSLLLRVPAPRANQIVRAIADKPPKIHPSISGVGDGQKMPLATQRRLASLEGYALPLHFDVPPPAKAQGVMDTMSSWGVAFDSWLTRVKQNRIEQRRMELARIQGQLQYAGVDPPLARHLDTPPGYIHGTPGGGGHSHSGSGGGLTQLVGFAQSFMDGRRDRRDMRKVGRRGQERGGLVSGLLLGPKKKPTWSGKWQMQTFLEHWATDKVLWLVIMNAEMDGEIDGIERAENMDDEEHVDVKTWQAER
ncbi:hypothetical protein MVEN_00445100 [Mycena venus]|uniref:Uncharacterized protein n=1 Tax=Mycena venus TaxID=2733690 RepID=A0A8H6YUZ8_9AGAR|nr:hypothetical protein MVEN_00445100 [Mycena venus]